jgi:hypothetical protein
MLDGPAWVGCSGAEMNAGSGKMSEAQTALLSVALTPITPHPHCSQLTVKAEGVGLTTFQLRHWS